MRRRFGIRRPYRKWERYFILYSAPGLDVVQHINSHKDRSKENIIIFWFRRKSWGSYDENRWPKWNEMTQVIIIGVNGILSRLTNRPSNGKTLFCCGGGIPTSGIQAWYFFLLCPREMERPWPKKSTRNSWLTSLSHQWDGGYIHKMSGGTQNTHSPSIWRHLLDTFTQQRKKPIISLWKFVLFSF